ncbi:MAG TPA: hypothetical protein PLE30_11485 [Candidatus Kapabacteria bacterium]|nr:hypothetical protein [Candidatus Kapabacteria bacterium]
MKNIIILIILTITTLSCCNERSSEKLELPEIYFNTKFTEIDTGKYNPISRARRFNFKSETEYSFIYSIHLYTRIDSLKLFKNEDLEIQTGIDFYDHDTLINLHCQIGVKYIKDYNLNSKLRDSISYLCYYIFWQNLEKRDTTNRRRHIIPKKWEINKDTRIIYSNIDELEIKRIFPFYKGKVINKNIDEVFVNYNFSTNNERFYGEIEFSGFETFGSYLTRNNYLKKKYTY